MSEQFVTLCRQWQDWAANADKSEEGWESDFPKWDELVAAACSIMRNSKLVELHLAEIELCWAISEETEDLFDCVTEHIDECWESLLTLADSRDARVRWQIYSVLPAGGKKAEPVLRSRLSDPDSYCRRRAILALAALNPRDSLELRQRFSTDEDAYIRQAAEEFGNSHK